MLPQRLARASALRTGLASVSAAASKRLPAVPRRGYMPTSYTDKRVLDEKFPDRQVLSEAEDPGMVSCGMARAP